MPCQPWHQSKIQTKNQNQKPETKTSKTLQNQNQKPRHTPKSKTSKTHQRGCDNIAQQLHHMGVRVLRMGLCSAKEPYSLETRLEECPGISWKVFFFFLYNIYIYVWKVLCGFGNF